MLISNHSRANRLAASKMNHDPKEKLIAGSGQRWLAYNRKAATTTLKDRRLAETAAGSIPRKTTFHCSVSEVTRSVTAPPDAGLRTGLSDLKQLSVDLVGELPHQLPLEQVTNGLLPGRTG